MADLSELTASALKAQNRVARSIALASALRAAWPAATASACSLRNEMDQHGDVMDAEGRLRAEWAEVVNSADVVSPARLLPPAADGTEFMACAIRFSGREFGRIALAVSNRDSESCGLFVSSFAHSAAAHLYVEARQVEWRAIHSDLKAELLQGDLGEIARPLTHDFNNFLNNLVLSLAVLEQSGEAPTSSLAPLRRQVDRVSTLIKEFHDYRRKSGAESLPFSLNELLQEAARSLTREGEHASQSFEQGEKRSSPRLTSDLSQELPQVVGLRSDFARMCRFLLRNVRLTASRSHSDVVVRTSAAAGKITLQIDLPQAAPEGESRPQQLESLVRFCPEVSNLELAACSAIARRFQGKFLVECRSDKTLSIRLDLPALTN
jgi:signal transduction histidine kinase